MFKLESPYKPTGDQPEAIKALVEGVKAGADAQVNMAKCGDVVIGIAEVVQMDERGRLAVVGEVQAAGRMGVRHVIPAFGGR